MKLSIKGVRITQQDVRLFNYLYAVKVATYDQIHRDIYTGYTRISVCNRVLKMERNKLLGGYRMATSLDSKKVVMLKKKGFDAFVTEGSVQRVELKSDAVEHDLSLVDIRHKLLKQGRVQRYFTENELQTWGNTLDHGHYSDLVSLRSDAVIIIEAPKGIFKAPIEYNSCQKSISRYIDLLDRYYNECDIPIVFFVYKVKRYMEQLMEIERKKVGHDRPKFFYALKTDILNSEVPTFFNCHGDKLRL